MTQALVQFAAAIWLIWISSYLPMPNVIYRIAMRVVPFGLAMMLITFSLAHFMGWPL